MHTVTFSDGSTGTVGKIMTFATTPGSYPAVSGRWDYRSSQYEIDRRVREYMARTGTREYGQAMAEVLRGDPDLKRAYASAPTRRTR